MSDGFEQVIQRHPGVKNEGISEVRDGLYRPLDLQDIAVVLVLKQRQVQMDQPQPLQFTLGGLQQLQQPFVIVLRLLRDGRRLLPRLDPDPVARLAILPWSIHHGCALSRAVPAQTGCSSTMSPPACRAERLIIDTPQIRGLRQPLWDESNER